MRAAIYARVSTGRQERDQAIDGQLTALRQWATEQGHELRPEHVFLFLLGVSFILMGLIAELIIRTYHESQAKPIYRVRDTRNVAAAARNPSVNGIFMRISKPMFM